MEAWLGAAGVVLIAALLLGVLIAVTWLTFPIATIVRSLGPGGHARWVRKALGAQTAVRDLGELCEAETSMAGVNIRVTWSHSHTEVKASGGTFPQVSPDPMLALRRLGDTDIGTELRWTTDRPPDPQLRRAVSLIVNALSP